MENQPGRALRCAHQGHTGDPKKSNFKHGTGYDKKKEIA